MDTLPKKEHDARLAPAGRKAVSRGGEVRRRRFWRFLRQTLLAGLLVVVGVFSWLAWQIDRTARIDETRHVDVIVVLGAVVNPDGSPGQDLIERTRHGVELYRAGWAETMLFTGGQGLYSASQQGPRLAIEMGVPAEVALSVEGPWETRGDASYSAALMREHGWHTALLVTHPLHCYRARLLFRQQGVEVYVSPTGPVSAVPQPWRTYYTLREAVGVVWPYLRLPDWFTAWLQEHVYGLE